MSPRSRIWAQNPDDSTRFSKIAMPDPINEALLARLEQPPPPEVADVMARYIRRKMYQLWHIPATYLIVDPNDAEAQANVKKLVAEINANDFIALDVDGKPCCLTGKPPALTPEGDPTEALLLARRAASA